MPDSGGNLHLKEAAFAGTLLLQGDGVLIEGSQLVVLTGVVDETLSGPVVGSFSVTALVDGQPAPIFTGGCTGSSRV